MPLTILVTGGAGFIGRHLAAALLERGHAVRVLDSLIEQVHGRAACRPATDAEFILGDVRDAGVLATALAGVDSVVHLAAEVGVGQSMYAIERYVSVNDLGAAALLQAILKHPVRRIVVASSMSIYGEGLYLDPAGRPHEQVVRSSPAAGAWDPLGPEGQLLRPAPTPESKRPGLASVYALTKYTQERLTLLTAQAYGLEAVALRLWNAFGPGQALSNPYTGVLAIFASRLLHGRSPLIFEDGQQQRDFIDIADVVQAFVLALEHPKASGVYNIASGSPRTVTEAAEALAKAMGREDIAPQVTGRVRAGDVRHCLADITRAQLELGYQPSASFDAGLSRLVQWVRSQKSTDRVQEASQELETRGLVA